MSGNDREFHDTVFHNSSYSGWKNNTVSRNEITIIQKLSSNFIIDHYIFKTELKITNSKSTDLKILDLIPIITDNLVKLFPDFGADFFGLRVAQGDDEIDALSGRDA